jgi:hypothetical protein
MIKGSTTWYNALTNRLGGNFGLGARYGADDSRTGSSEPGDLGSGICLTGRTVSRSDSALGVISPSVASTNPSPTVAVDVYLAGWPWRPWRGSVRSWRFRPLGAVRHPRQSTLALTVADGQYAAVARPARMSAGPDEGRHRLLASDPHAARGDVQCATTGLA